MWLSQLAVATWPRPDIEEEDESLEESDDEAEDEVADEDFEE